LLNDAGETVVNSPRPNGFSLLEIVLVVGLIGVISAIAVPMFGNAIAGFRLSGDARSVSNAAAVAKMRAASDFSRARIFIDLTAGTHHIERWNKTTSAWNVEGGITMLSSGVSFSYGPVTVPPPNTQATIGQASQCLDDTATPIANTACIMFNSRGVPIDASFAPTGADALYLTDGSAVYSVTIAATGMLRLWRALPVAVPTWVLS
jgi:prepilin-type N-terminal cleavage/methylation domain-containing protein